MKKIIAIDVDRTLVDSFEHELISLQEAIENVTGMKIDNELMSKLTTLPTKVFFKSFFHATPCPSTLWKSSSILSLDISKLVPLSSTFP